MSERRIEDALPRGTAAYGSVVVVHFDGACQPPKGGGVATFGFTVSGEGYEGEACGLAVAPWSPRATNNVAEYVAAIRALEWLKDRSYRGPVLLLGDSQLVIRQMNGEYEVRAEHLRQYQQHLARLADEFVQVRFSWIPREENARADALSKVALEEAQASARHLRPTGEPVPVPEEDDSPEA